MEARAEQALVGADVPAAAQNLFSEQHSLHASAPFPEGSAEFLRRDIQRLFSQKTGKFRQSRFRNKEHSAKAADVRIPQLASIVENEKAMRVGRNRFAGMNYRQPPRHSKMDDEAEPRYRSNKFTRRGTCIHRDTYKFSHAGYV